MSVLEEFKEYALNHAKYAVKVYESLAGLNSNFIKEDPDKAEFYIRANLYYINDCRKLYEIEPTLEEEEFWDKLLTEFSKREAK